MSTLRDIARTIPCAYCYDHGVRTQPIYDPWRVGYEVGQRDILAALDDDTWGPRYIEARRKGLERADG